MKKRVLAGLATVALAASAAQAEVYFQDTFTNGSGGADTTLSPETGTWRSAGVYAAGADSGNLFGEGTTNGVLHLSGTSVLNDARNASSTLLQSGRISFDYYEPASNLADLRVYLVIGGTTVTSNYIRLKDGAITLLASGTYSVDSVVHVDVLFNSGSSPVSAPGFADPVPANQVKVYLNGSYGAGQALAAGSQGNSLTNTVSGLRLQIPAVTGADFYVDNLAIESIPEPAAFGVLALAGLSMCRRPRKQ